EQLVTANAARGLTSSLGRLIGPAIGGTLLGTLGLRSVVYADSASFFIAAALTLGIVVPREAVTTSVAPAKSVRQLWLTTWQEWLGGLRLVIARPLVTTVFAVDGLEGLADGLFQVVIVVFIREVLAGGAQDFGWMMSVSALGRIV